LLDDAKSIAAVVELFPKPMEARSGAFMDEFHSVLERMLVESFPGKDDYPWIMQVYNFMDRDILRNDWRKMTEKYVNGSSAQNIRAVFDDHIDYVAKSKGVFRDPIDGLHPWRGGRQRVFCCIYRRHPYADKGSRMKELDQQLQRFYHQLSIAGVVYHELGDVDICTWLQRWFKPDACAMSAERLASLRKGIDYNLSDAVCPRVVRSDDSSGLWCFEDRFGLVMNLQRLRMPPEIGQLSLANKSAQRSSSMVEQLPPHAVTVMTIAFTTSKLISNHLDRIDGHAVGQKIEALSARIATDEARNYMLYGGRFYPFSLAVYLNAGSNKELLSQVEEVDALCLANEIQLFRPEQDPVALDAYLRHMPMGYRYSLNQLRYRSSIIYVRDAASLLPLYGRPSGSGRLGLTFFNRGGGLFSYNPLDLQDRAKNAHLFIFGPTGAGKSATLIYLQMLLMAFHKPRIIAVEAGNSYGLLAEYLASQKFKVRNEVLRPGCTTKLAPFANARYLKSGLHTKHDNKSSRDWLGEMMLIARLMVTGGRPEEEARFNRADETVLARAISAAGDSCKGSPRVTDVHAALSAQAKSHDSSRAPRIREMADAMELFTMGFAGELFNQEGSEWEATDYVRLELGALASGDHKDMLAVAWLGVMNTVIAFAEANQQDGRPIILLTDEAHMITCNPLLSSYMVKISKLLGRRLGLWLWMATQNMSDFPGESGKMLSMFEWWLALGLGHSDIETLCQYKPLTSNTISMLEKTHKVPGKYAEGTLLGDQISERFRHVPPALCLALAQTEKEEKTKRAELMKRHGCSELEAALKIAEDIQSGRMRST
jgi:conjugative transfer ATPase